MTNLGYILGCGHSGSTLLAMLLGVQSRACTVGEMRAPATGNPDLYRCSCGARMTECDFWKSVSVEMAKKGIAQFDILNASLGIDEVENDYIRRLLGPLPRGQFLEATRDIALGLSPAWKPHLRNVQSRNAALVEVLQGITGAKLVVDSSKTALQLKYLLKSPALTIKVIYLLRDGRAVALSMIGHGLKRETRSETVVAASLAWRRSNESAEQLLSRLPSSQWLQVKYENLCRSPEKTMLQLCGFLELGSRDITLDFRSRQQHVIGNEMRLKTTSDIRLDERWRTQLSAEDLQVFENTAGDLNRKYGYQ